MNGCTVDIADFRCRESKPRAVRPMVRSTQSSAGLSLVETKSEPRPAVYNIGEAPDGQRLRIRLKSRPVTMQRRANVIRFRSNEPIRLSVRVVDEPRNGWSGMSEDSYDLPPAA